MSVPEPKAAFGRVPCQIAKVPEADLHRFLPTACSPPSGGGRDVASAFRYKRKTAFMGRHDQKSQSAHPSRRMRMKGWAAFPAPSDCANSAENGNSPQIK
jgi:hypothetical protein